jgi:hypothetical protein
VLSVDRIPVVVGATNLPEPANGLLKFLLVAAPWRHHHHPIPEMACPVSVRAAGLCFSVPIRRADARAGAPETIKRNLSNMNRSGVSLPARLANGALFFSASRAFPLAGPRCRETIASQAEITLHQQRNLLVLWALAGWVWRV